ncbi:hypothetical protein VHUM_02377 [Vanrija humicola]|uniref:Major facilitator superfamily (MFS) profile domain-containing protein n=1 Tax=Vanrija humicola TaxID=5417 RepID=A0A7D8V028_VANHU|nr:hypothetical protein VHUM_02377 [Vanrija humicola]
MSSAEKALHRAESKKSASVLDAADVAILESEDALTPEERRAERNFVWRLDAVFITVAWLSYVFKYLDQTNISNAYVSGMKEEIHIVGNQYNYFTTLFNAGYIVMLYPSCILISHVGPSVWLPGCELVWGVLTCTLSLAQSYRTVYGLRFLIGLAEGSAWPGYITLISQWYLPHEVAFRMALFNCAQPVGAMLSGALQGALSTHLEDVLGRSGWRWAFIVNGVMTIAVALVAFVALPGYPERPNPLAKWYLGPREIKIAQARNARVHRSPQRGITGKSFLRALTFWPLWLIAIAWSWGSNTTPANYYNLWLKSLKLPDGHARYSVAMLNYLPIIGQALQLVTQLLLTFASDLTGKRLPWLLVHSAINLTSQVILVIRPADRHAYMAGWYLNYCGAASTMLLAAWGSGYLQDEPEVRTILFATGTVFSYIQNAFLPIAAFPASEAPNWRIGAKVYLGAMAFSTVLFIIISFLFRRVDKIREEQAKRGEKDEDSRSLRFWVY